MARLKRAEVYRTLTESPLVPVFYNEHAEILKKVISACYEGGVRIFEFTNRGDFALEIFGQIGKWARKECPALVLGAGTVLDAPTAALYIQESVEFIVSPLLNPEVVKICNRRQIACIPGCGSVSEINYAQELGAEFVKIFPGDVLGPSFVKGIKAPMPWTKIMVTGGVSADEENISQWIHAGADCLGIGSKLFSRDLILNGEWNKIRDSCKKILKTINEIKGIA